MEKIGARSVSARRPAVRRYTFLCLLLLAVVAPAGWVMASETSQPYIVLFDDPDAANPSAVGSPVGFLAVAGPAAPDVESGLFIRRVRTMSASHHFSVGSIYTHAVLGFSAKLNARQLRTVAADPSVAAVIRDEVIQIDDLTAGDQAGGVRTTANPGNRVPPGVRRVGARQSNATGVRVGGGGVNADVAIIDTGVQRDHPDLNVVGGYNCTGRKREKWDDTNGHGTHVAGIAGALDNRIGVVGVAPGVRLWSVKVLDGRGSGHLSWMVCGVDWVTAQRQPGAPSRPLIEVANMSISFSLPYGDDRDCGGQRGDPLHEAICHSVARGTTYVVAAGNESHNARRNRPAAYDEVITVSAMADYDGRGGGHGQSSDSCPYWNPEPDDAFANFSNFGPDVDLIAPGKCVLSTFTRSRYAWMSGTSMATPHVTGAAVIYRLRFPRATPHQVRLALQAVARMDWRTQTDPDRDTHEGALWIGEFRAMPDFTMRASRAQGTVAVGERFAIPVSVSRISGFSEQITVNLADPPAGFVATTLVLRDRNTGELGIEVRPRATGGTHELTVVARSGDLVRTAIVHVTVGGRAPSASFTSPTSVLTIQSEASVPVAWREAAGDAAISGRQLERLSGRVREAGTCDDVRWATDYSRSRATQTTDATRSGYCYRWRLTLTDSAGMRATAESGSVLVDATSPRAPSVSLSDAEIAVNLDRIGVDEAYVGHSGMLWVRSGASGSVDLDVRSADAESGIAAFRARASGAGWSVDWLGSSAAGALRLFYAARGGEATLSVNAVNGAGLESPAAVGRLMRDATNPVAVSWATPPAGSTRTIALTRQRLAWDGGSDTDSGLSRVHIVRRYRAPLRADGTFNRNGFSADGDFRLVANGAVESDLEQGYVYVWSLRTLDNVGNYAPSVISGYVLVPGR